MLLQRQIQPQLGTAQQYLILRFEICKMRLKLGTDDQYLSVPIFYFPLIHKDLFYSPQPLTRILRLYSPLVKFEKIRGFLISFKISQYF